MSLWNEPYVKKEAFDLEERLHELVRSAARGGRYHHFATQLYENQKLAVFYIYDDDTTTLRYVTLMQTALHQAQSVEFPRYVRQVIKDQMLHHGTASDEWFKVTIHVIYSRQGAGTEPPSTDEISRVLDEHLSQIEPGEDEIHMQQSLAVSMSTGSDFRLFEGMDHSI